MSFRTANAAHATSIVRDIKTLRSLIQQRDKEKAERATLVKQEKLVIGKVRAQAILLIREFPHPLIKPAHFWTTVESILCFKGGVHETCICK